MSASSRRTPKSTRSKRGATTWRSAAPAPCSSAIPRSRSPISPGAVRPGGRLVLLTWQGPDANEWIRELSGAMTTGRELPAPAADMPGPFALADPQRVRAILGGAGFTNVEIEDRTEPMWFGDDRDDAQRFVLGLLGWMLHGAGDDARSRALEAVTATLAAHESGDGVLYASGAWTILATRP